MEILYDYPLVMTNIAMENHHFYVFLLGKYGKPSINGQFSMGFFDFLVGCFKIQDTLTVQ